MNNSNENFAEVFTAFVTEPSLLLRSPACRKSLQFFKNWFGDGERVNECM